MADAHPAVTTLRQLIGDIEKLDESDRKRASAAFNEMIVRLDRSAPHG